MKKLLYLALAGSLLMGCCQKTECQHDGQPCEKCIAMKQQAILDNLQTRVSVRQFTGEKISQEQIETLLRCAMAAPTAINSQPWAFMVITDEALLQRLGEFNPVNRCGNHPACAFVPCGDMSKAIQRCPDFWINDVSAATENLLLAAHAMGLGAVWTGVHPDMEHVAKIREILGLPEHIIPMCIVPVGVPAEQPAVKDKYNEANIHYNVW